MGTDQSAHAQAEPIIANEEEFFPEHPPRTETKEYEATHKLLVKTLDTPCRICGVRNSTLSNPSENPDQAKQLESHHYPVQREYFDACDWKKVAKDFPQYVKDQSSFEKFVDSPANMWIICDVHHRHPTKGIHHAITNDWIIERYLLDGYILDDSSKNAAPDIAKDNEVVDDNVPAVNRL